MGLLSAISNAVSGLNVNQQNLNVLSQNISNANTANYSNEVVNQQAAYDNGLGVGVSIKDITRTVNQFLSAEVQSQTSVNSSASTVQSYYAQIENLLGQPGGTNSIDQGIDSFFTALQGLANSPGASTETSAINAGVTVSNQISGLAGALQSLQLQADSSISNAVNSVNTDLQTLFSTNTALERAAATNQGTSGLLDQRDAALTDIAQYMDISPTYQNDGEVSLSTTNGITLLTTTSSSKLSYQPASSTTSFSGTAHLSPIQVQTLNSTGSPIGPPTTLATGGTTSNVSTSLVSGQIQALLSVRDTIIPNILSQLDGLAANLRNSVNAISNEGSSFPPPNSYTGTRLVSGTGNATQWGGSLQIALLDANGNPVPSPYSDERNGEQPLTLNLGALQGSGGSAGVLTTNDIINAINQYYSSPQNKTEIGNINNVQLGMLSNNVPDAGATPNFSFDFNLNNISANNANFYVSGVTVLDSNGNPLPGTDVTSTQASTALSSYTATAANTITVATAGTNSFTNGETVYIPAAGALVNGTALPSGYYTVQNATGTSFDITLAGVTAGGGATSAVGTSALPPYATVNSGQTLRTGANGSFNVSNISPASPFYTVEANIATVDSTGNVITSTVSYTVPNNTVNVANNLIGASSIVSGSASLVTPNTNQPQITATLVDANGNPLQETNNSYGNQQGYLKITANNSSYTVAINELDSIEQGLPNASVPVPGTNEGFSQYFGLNNFFNNNNLTSTGDTVAGSALNLSVSSRLINNPSLIPTGMLSPSNQPSSGSGTATPNFTYLVAPGDNSISQKLAGLATSEQNFNAIGGMPESTTTMAQYAGQIIAKASNDSTDATNSANDSQTLLTGFTQRAQSVSGVNLDQELANTVIYQNAYSASTRVITVVSNMFTDLLSIIQ